MKASVIIPTINRKKYLAECIGSIFSCSHQSSLLEIIVIDNNSTDGTMEFLKELAEKDPRLKLTQILERNAIKARNLGFSMASGDIIMHIDDDIVVDKEWLRNLIAPYTDESVGGVGGRLLVFGQKANAGHIVGRITPWGQFFTNFDTQQKREVDFLHGSNMSFRKDIVIKVKGLDPSYKTNWREETDLCLKIRKLGYRLIFQPTALVWHRAVGSKARLSSESRLYRYFWCREYFYYKNIFSLKSILWSPIFTLSEATLCMTICTKQSMIQYIRKCLQGIKEGSIAGLRYNRYKWAKCKSLMLDVVQRREVP